MMDVQTNVRVMNTHEILRSTDDSMKGPDSLAKDETEHN
jgi:hypothetical protein